MIMNIKKKGQSVAAFISNLYQLLNSETYPTTITWNKDSPGFTIHDAKAFEEIVCRHFRNASAKSFYRQLQIYGFKRTSDRRRTRRTTQTYDASFHHNHFNPNRPDELVLIRRETLKPSSKFKYFHYKPKTQEKDNSACKILPKQEQDEEIPLLNFPPDYPWFLEYL
ncbi:hypothetical protein DSO57_1017040 [Entomophthora muscae]|uniref:Uncharacterized protein n=1 Tax=Entomophthora muscae TaxID=34485 RepID=A0ACC2SHM9_9FUNG|nr:hypothetical protein DSO57_1017040 [Entomophthora muscae]